jgi:hypothetical protein
LSFVKQVPALGGLSRVPEGFDKLHIVTFDALHFNRCHSEQDPTQHFDFDAVDTHPGGIQWWGVVAPDFFP